MRINVGGSAINGTYPLIIVGTNGTLTNSTPFTLIIVKKPVPEFPIWTLLLILALTILGIALSLVAYALSSRRGAGPGRGGRMYVVPSAAQRVPCPHCGRPIPLQAVYCPHCGWRRGGAVAGATVVGPVAGRGYIGRRATWGFVLALASSVLILLNSAALLQSGFWGPPTDWSLVFWWLGGSSGLGQPFAVLVGLMAGLIVLTGGMMMISRRGVLGAFLALPFAALSFVIGGGFVIGAVLGIVAGILGALGR